MNTRKWVAFYGVMRRRFGKGRWLAVGSVAEVSRALNATMPGWREFCLKHNFKIVVGGAPIGEANLLDPVGRSEVIKLVPVVAGSKDEMWQMVGGAVLYAAGTYISAYYPGAGAFLQNMGVAMMLGGVAQMLADVPAGQFGADSANDIETFGFSSPTLTTGQGGVVPIGYGRVRVGGHVISAGVDAQTWQKGGFGGRATTEDGTRYGDGSLAPWVWAIAPV